MRVVYTLPLDVYDCSKSTVFKFQALLSKVTQKLHITIKMTRSIDIKNYLINVTIERE